MSLIVIVMECNINPQNSHCVDGMKADLSGCTVLQTPLRLKTRMYLIYFLNSAGRSCLEDKGHQFM